MTANIPDESADPQQPNEFIVYRTDDGRSEVYLRAVNGTVWLSQAEIADLYETSTQNVQQIIQRVLADREVTEATINSELIVRYEGTRQVKRTIKHYSLDMVLAVGYRATTPRAVQFRQWATDVLSEYLVKGYVMNDEKLKDPAGLDYFDELLERIRDIRASEKRFYQKVRDVFAQTSADYDKDAPAAQTFFATIQNKLLYAVTGHTAAELICKRVDASKANMGLTSWKGSVVRKGDISTSKNYLTDDEILSLNRLTTMFLDYAEDRASQKQQITMAEWTQKTDAFLTFNERGVLQGAGRVSSERMKTVVGQEYNEFDGRRKKEAAELADREHLAELETIQAEIERKK